MSALAGLRCSCSLGATALQDALLQELAASSLLPHPSGDSRPPSRHRCGETGLCPWRVGAWATRCPPLSFEALGETAVNGRSIYLVARWPTQLPRSDFEAHVRGPFRWHFLTKSIFFGLEPVSREEWQGDLLPSCQAPLPGRSLQLRIFPGVASSGVPPVAPKQTNKSRPRMSHEMDVEARL